MLRTVVGSFLFRLVVSTIEVRNAAPKGSFLATLVRFGSSVGGIDDGIACESWRPSVDEDKSSSLPKIFADNFFLEDVESDFDSSLNNPIRPSSLE